MKDSYADYLATIEALVGSVDMAHRTSTSATRKQDDDLRELAESHQREAQRIQSRIRAATDHYQAAAKSLHEQPVARLNTRLPERAHPAEPGSGSSSAAAEQSQSRAAKSLARATSDYAHAFATHQRTAASAADALAARRAALADRPSATPWWRTPRTIAITAAVLAILLVLAIVAVVT